ncbi:MAG: alkaline phosphatase family protein [Deltaproteobacteria bacterium]|nr:alkaline phosphatase family protein [Deltaproteobacteria bacterium]
MASLSTGAWAAPGAAPAAKAGPAPAGKAPAAVAPGKTAAKAVHAPGKGGRLVLFVSIDQLRYEDLLLLRDEFGPKGFAGLGRPQQMRYLTTVTETAADHATLSTGAWADIHGVVANKWLEDGKPRQSIDDAACPLWDNPKDGRSAAALRVPTVGDALKLASVGQSRVVTIGNKDRVALLLGGRSADLALFWDDSTGQFTSTTCYTKDAPKWVEELRKTTSAANFLDYVWTPSRPMETLARYSDPEAPGVVPKSKMGERFPHAIGQQDHTTRLFYALRQTPVATTLALSAAKAAIEAYDLGNGNKPDLLMVGIATIDGIGHMFGAHSPERIDGLLRLHDELGAFLTWARARYGDRLEIVLAADHGVQPIPAQSQKLKLEAQVLSRDKLAAKVEDALTKALGTAPGGKGYISFFDPPALSLKRDQAGDLRRAVHLAAEALRTEPGLWRVVETADAANEPEVIRHAIYPGRVADLLLVPRPLYMMLKDEDGADHGSPWNDDALVPFLFEAKGWTVRPAVRGGVLTATQVAPTLAALLEISPPSAAMADPVLEHLGE